MKSVSLNKEEVLSIEKQLNSNSIFDPSYPYRKGTGSGYCVLERRIDGNGVLRVFDYSEVKRNVE